MPKPLRPRESTSSINSSPPMTLVFSIGILSLLHALLCSTHSQFSVLFLFFPFIHFLCFSFSDS
ncbi:uncharacterized protein DS421_20g692740 [Arachis hypogaea]|nr:uncharacterized protein DS421_20g692740 [Arachis hypogaea]